jgi:hypothetical protein
LLISGGIMKFGSRIALVAVVQ